MVVLAIHNIISLKIIITVLQQIFVIKNKYNMTVVVWKHGPAGTSKGKYIENNNDNNNNNNNNIIK